MEPKSQEPPSAVGESSPRARGLLAVVVVGAVGVAIVVGATRATATGSIRSGGSPHGDFVVHPVTCFSGTHWGFDGVWVVVEPWSEGGRKGFKGGLKLVKAGDGRWTAQVENPDECDGFKCVQRTLERRHCDTFDIVVDSSGIWRGASGRARIACELPEGGTVDVDVTFADCADVETGVDP